MQLQNTLNVELIQGFEHFIFLNLNLHLSQNEYTMNI